MRNPWIIVRKPVVTEKAHRLSENQRHVYTFMVDMDANKHEIKNAVEKAFGVKVEKVRTLIYKGKRKMMRNLRLMGKRRDWKKAYVTLKEGHRLDIY
jgi:large subunit ribosomal protein L23